MSKPLIVSSYTSPHVMKITLNRPEKRNALSIALMKELLECLKSIKSETRILILEGSGDFFCAGLDLEEAQDDALHATASALVAETFRALALAPCATIAFVRGGALAGGVGLVAACDLAIATVGARFSLPELRRGLIPALVTSLLQNQIPKRFLSELVLTGEPVTAERAYEMGMINQVANEEALNTLVEKILKAAPESLHFYKKFFLQLNLEAELMRSLDLHRQRRNSPEAMEGIRAFLEKRPPYWQVR